MQCMQRPMAWILSALLAVLPMVPAQAAMIGTDRIVNPAQTRPAADQLQRFLDQAAAQQQLQALGVNPEHVRERINSLSDAELARVSQGIENLNAGGDSVLGILLVIFIVFVITDVIGATDIFPFIHPVR